MPIEKPLARICGEPRREKGAGRVGLAVFIADMGKTMRDMGVVRVRRQRSLDLRPGHRELPILGQRHRVIGREPEIIAVIRARLSISTAIWCFCPIRPEPPIRPFGFAPTETTRASRGHAARCAYKAAIAASVRPANTRSKNPIWLASRSDRPADTSFATANAARAAEKSPCRISTCALLA